MNLPRYRRPSLNTILGITKANKPVKTELGITAVYPHSHWPIQQRTTA